MNKSLIHSFVVFLIYMNKILKTRILE